MQYVLSEQEYQMLLRAGAEAKPWFWLDKPMTLADCQRQYVRAVIASHGGNLSQAARVLGVHRQTAAKLAGVGSPKN